MAVPSVWGGKGTSQPLRRLGARGARCAAPIGPSAVRLVRPDQVRRSQWVHVLIAIICVRTGVVFVLPLRAKSEAVSALWAFARWFALRAPAMEAALGMTQGSLKLGELRCDRGGEFTCTGGSTKRLLTRRSKRPSSAAGWGLWTRRRRRSYTLSSFGEPWAMRLMPVRARRVKLPGTNSTL